MSGFQHASNSTPCSSPSPYYPIEEEDDWFVPDFRRRGSLPTDESASVEKQLAVRKPKSTRERSWLSLDLASQRSSSSMRSMPSPKPVPSVSLPALPTLPERSASPTPSSVLIPLSPKFSPRKNQLSTTSAPKPTRVSFAPSSPPKRISSGAKPAAVSSTAVNRTNSVRTSSTVSTRYRRARRTDALAQLEGRASHWEGRFSWQPVPTRKNSIKRSFNFMSMSDDEAESDEEESFFDVGFDFTPSSDHNRSHSSPDVPLSPTERISGWLTSPTSPNAQAFTFPQPAASLGQALGQKRRRSLTVSNLLTSFIDLEKEGGESRRRDSKPWRGRSFIEISSL
ncbi:hypothetical protein AAF712_006889 [Marasmius tenuissimus]|uniref:Uncharacterized protein n=1 Tax=Marasmius tenuissimus TaxID=585030 RepID=A0ABR2ZYA6_9AGAR|nr:hypothetical protein PM082_010343 [Marasmius tenuissimus]